MCGENKKRRGRGRRKKKSRHVYSLHTKKIIKLFFSLLTNKFFDYLNSDWVMKFTG
jgi:hypothetical protein